MTHSYTQLHTYRETDVESIHKNLATLGMRDTLLLPYNLLGQNARAFEDAGVLRPGSGSQQGTVLSLRLVGVWIAGVRRLEDRNH